MALMFDNLRLLPFYEDSKPAKELPVSQCIQDELPDFSSVNSSLSVSVAAVCSIAVLIAIVCFLVYRRIKIHMTGYDTFGVPETADYII